MLPTLIACPSAKLLPEFGLGSRESADGRLPLAAAVVGATAAALIAAQRKDKKIASNSARAGCLRREDTLHPATLKQAFDKLS